MKRVYIFGGTGSGKTTLAKKISERLKIPFYTTDNFVYRDTWTSKYMCTDKQRDKNFQKVVGKENWIIEGVHRGDWIFPAIIKADFVILLDIPRRLLIIRVIKRFFNQRFGLEENIKKETFKTFLPLLKYAYIYKNENLIYHKRFIKEFNKKSIILENNKQINRFLSGLK